MTRANQQPQRRAAQSGPGRPPDYNLSALDKQTEVRGQIGVAWIQDDGRISIKLNPFVVLDTFHMDLTLSLFPRNDRDATGPAGDREVPY